MTFQNLKNKMQLTSSLAGEATLLLFPYILNFILILLGQFKMNVLSLILEIISIPILLVIVYYVINLILALMEILLEKLKVSFSLYSLQNKLISIVLGGIGILIAGGYLYDGFVNHNNDVFIVFGALALICLVIFIFKKHEPSKLVDFTDNLMAEIESKSTSHYISAFLGIITFLAIGGYLLYKSDKIQLSIDDSINYALSIVFIPFSVYIVSLIILSLLSKGINGKKIANILLILLTCIICGAIGYVMFLFINLILKGGIHKDDLGAIAICECLLLLMIIIIRIVAKKIEGE